MSREPIRDISEAIVRMAYATWGAGSLTAIAYCRTMVISLALAGCGPGVMYLRHMMPDDGGTYASRGRVIIDYFEDDRPSYELKNIWSGTTEPSAPVFLAEVFRKETEASGMFMMSLAVTPPLAPELANDTTGYVLSGHIESFRIGRFGSGMSNAYTPIILGGTAIDLASATQGTASYVGLLGSVALCSVLASVDRDDVVATVRYEASLRKGQEIVWKGTAEHTETDEIMNWRGPGKCQVVGARLLDRAATAAVRGTLKEVAAQLSAGEGRLR